MISPGDSASVKVAKGAAIIFAGLIFARLVNYSYQILVTKIAGAAEFGLFFLGVSTLAVAAGVAVLGFDSGVARFAPYYIGGKEKSKLRGVLRGAFLLSLLNGAVAGAILWLFSGTLAGLYFGDQAERGAVIIRICAVILPFAVSRLVLVKSIVAFQKIGYRVAVNQFTGPIVRLTLTAVLLGAGMAAEGAILAYAASELVCWFALLWILQTRVHPLFGSGGGGFDLKPFMLYCLPLVLSGLVMQVMNYIDAFMAGYFLNPVQVGIFGAAARLAALVALGVELLNPLFLSITTGAFAQGNHKLVGDTFNNNNRWYLFLGLPVVCLLAILAPQAMTLVWGGQFGEGANVLALLAVGRTVYYLSATSMLLLSMYARTKLILLLNIAAASVNVALNWWLIPRLGIEGAALATSCSLTLHALLMITFARGSHQPGGLRVLFPRVLAAAVPACLLVFWIRNLALDALPTLILGGFLFCVAYPLALKLFGAFQEEDRQILRQIGRQLGFGAELDG